MDAPPPPPPLSAVSTTTTTDSLDSSPRARATDSIPDDSLPATVAGATKIRLMCSYGGHIIPRPHDKSLCYVGGDTRIVVIDRSSTLLDLLSRLSKILFNGRPFTLKYQLPSEDLDSLITVSTDEDLDNMIDEYDRLLGNLGSSKPPRIRLFLFPVKPEVLPSSNSIGSILDGSNRSEDWFLNALNGGSSGGVLQRGFSDPANSVNCLLGLDESVNHSVNNNANSGNSDLNDLKEVEGGQRDGKVGGKYQDVQSVPDSPIVGTTSSFGSTSSSPSLANLPPIRVHMEEGGGSGGAGGGGVRVLDQFSQMGLGVQQKQEEGFVVLSSPLTVAPPVAVTVAAGVVTGVPTVAGGGSGGGGGGGISNRVFSDDERSDHGVPVGYKIATQPVMNSQRHQMQQLGGDLPSPDSVSSDSSLSNAFGRQKPMMYQEQVSQIPPGANRVASDLVDPNNRIQLQQVADGAYAASQYDQHEQQLLQQQQQPQQAQMQPQQFIQAGSHFVHHHPTGTVPITSYYPVYPSQQTHHPHHAQLDQRYPVYYLSAGHPQAYSLPLQQQPNMVEAANSVPSSRPQTPPNPTMLTMPPLKPEMASGVYRTTAATGPQLVQVPASQTQTQPQSHPQQQFVGYTQIHHPSQSMAPSSVSSATYAYEYADPARGQIYYTQPLAPALASQYQAMASAHGVTLPDASAQLPVDNIKQQTRTSQPL